MTGTAETESEEFHQVYELEVIQVPPNKIIVRDDKTDRIYKTEAAKFKAIIKEVGRLHKKGQPVLIGTVSIEKNELLGKLLKKAGIRHQVLNAKNNEREASIVSKAGERGAITLATNIAGRGTDIVLNKETKKLGGLFVLGSERHESRRIDNQLRGRSGRQGDPGASQFFVSCEDDLMRIFGGERIASVMNRLTDSEDQPVENRFISKSLEGAQKKVEGFHYDQRKNVVKYDDVMNRHRRATYTMRREILKQPDISARIKSIIDQEAQVLASSPHATAAGFEDIIQEVFPFDEADLDKVFDTDINKFPMVLSAKARELYEARESAFGTEIMRKVERDIYIQVLDNLWMQHLEEMDHLRNGIGWISVAQKDPLVEYRRQAQGMFEDMQATLRRDILRASYSAQPVREDQLDRPIETELTRAARRSIDNADKILEADEFEESDFINAPVDVAPPLSLSAETKPKQPVSHKKKTTKAKSRKAERKRRAKGRRK